MRDVGMMVLVGLTYIIVYNVGFNKGAGVSAAILNELLKNKTENTNKGE